MTIWVDADACPKAVRDIVIKAAQRTNTKAVFVANHGLPINRTAVIQCLSVPSGADAADALIVEKSGQGDLVITADLPLANDALSKGARVLTPRGEELNANNIGARLNMRDFMESMRASGEHGGGQKPLNERDIRTFANAFDALLNKLSRHG